MTSAGATLAASGRAAVQLASLPSVPAKRAMSCAPALTATASTDITLSTWASEPPGQSALNKLALARALARPAKTTSLDELAAWPTNQDCQRVLWSIQVDREGIARTIVQ